jgi:TolA-binding protein
LIIKGFNKSLKSDGDFSMSPVSNISRFFILVMITVSLSLGGCSYIPWIGNDEEDDLAFEEDFPFEEDVPAGGDTGSSEDDFFAEDDGFGNDDGFGSMNQAGDTGELKGDVENLQSQQEALVSKVRELEEVINVMEPKIAAAEERLEGSLSAATSQSEFLEPEVEELKTQVAMLNAEIEQIKTQQASAAPVRKTMSSRKMRSSSQTSQEYDQALSAYRKGDYDESILLFQNYALSDPPASLQDNILFWIGSNYVQLEMYDDAIKQFKVVVDKYPRGNKVHDSRYMLGVSYYRKGETSQAINVLESALKRQPPADVRGKIMAQLKKIQ